MSYQDLLNAVARVVGGTQPDPTNNPYWFSGQDSNDGTGVAGLAGCYSLPPAQFAQDPCAMLLPSNWLPLEPFPTQGHTFRQDVVLVRVMAGHDDLQATLARLVNFAETIPDTFDQHMQLLGQAYVLAANCNMGRFLEVDWPPVYLCVEFQLQIQRGLPVTYRG